MDSKIDLQEILEKEKGHTRDSSLGRGFNRT